MGRKFNPEYAHVLHSTSRWWYEPPERLVFLFDMGRGKRILEVGVGTGYFLLHLARMYPEVEFIGTDVQEEMLEVAKERAEGLRNVRLLKNDEDRLPIEGNGIDGVLLAHSFHELERPNTMLKEVMRILRPGGKVVVVDWKPVPTPFGPPLSERVPVEEVLNSLERVGFANVREYDLYPYHYVVTGAKTYTISTN